MPDRLSLVVGTAGHIDHGKSRLVHALTGVDPDRLPEEKARGMTIDLGFSHMLSGDIDFYFVDVPGHERFIRNMVAGATGIDLAMLVVAADDSIMPQTREHAELLALLGVNRVILVLTKIDLVDSDWAEAVETEAAGLLASVGISPVDIVKTSAEDGRGLDQLRSVLAAAARTSTFSAVPYRWFRLPIDRAFNIAGRGAVVTGSVAHGGVERDDELALLPSERIVRVRDLQRHNNPTTVAAGRARLAVNLANITLGELSRGHELATPGYLTPTRLLDVALTTLRMPGKLHRQRIRVRLHIGTAETLAELRLLDPPQGGVTRDAFAQIHAAAPVVAAWGQRFVVRDEPGARTLGGGQVVHAEPTRWASDRIPTRTRLEFLRDGSPSVRLEQILLDAPWATRTDERLASLIGLPDASSVQQIVDDLSREKKLVTLVSASALLRLHADTLKLVVAGLKRKIDRVLAENPRFPGITRAEWPGWMPRACPARFRPLLADHLIESGMFTLQNNFIILTGKEPVLKPGDQALYDQVINTIRSGRFQPPSPSALSFRTPRNARRIDELVALADARGELVRLDAGIWIHRACWDEAARIITGEIAEHGPKTVSEIRSLLNSSRKYTVPLVESFDHAGVTRRRGDVRELGEFGGRSKHSDAAARPTDAKLSSES